MNFKDYQEQALRYAVYPNMGNDFTYLALALNEEAGEVAGKVKKLMRDKGVFTPSGLTEEDRQAMCKELGDILWYLSALSSEIGSSLDEVAAGNLAKINDRHNRGMVSGSGDDR